jgi:TetR/AcrR family transcriptional repressor of lmrAB and yxaGH operons
MSMASDTRQQMITTAARLFQREGYHATSWRRLVEEADAPWGSIHHHFPGGKEELGVAAIEAGRDGVIAVIDHCFSRESVAAEAVGRWFELTSRRLVATGFESGCPVATIALELVADRGPVQDATRTALAAWEKRLALHLRQAGVTRGLAADAAVSVLALMEGGLLLARARGNISPMRVASRHAQAIVSNAAGDSTVAVT